MTISMTRAGRPPTLEEVADLAGVSRSTASRVVNNSSRVTVAATASVQAAIEELGYVPNHAARSLASRRSAVVALVLPEPTGKVFADPFFAAITQGIAMRLLDSDFTLNLLVAAESRPEKTRRYLSRVDGALVVSHHRGDLSAAGLDGVPVVFSGRPLTAPVGTVHSVDSDNEAGAAAAVRHLAATGRSRIALISGPQDMAPGLDRRRGAERAALEHGVVIAGRASGDFSPESGARAAATLLKKGVRFDGLFAANDQMASGAVAELRRRGLGVPTDVAIVGFDDDQFARACTPPLTTIRQDVPLIGATMATVLLGLIEGREVPRTTSIPTELVLREST